MGCVATLRAVVLSGRKKAHRLSAHGLCAQMPWCGSCATAVLQAVPSDRHCRLAGGYCQLVAMIRKSRDLFVCAEEPAEEWGHHVRGTCNLSSWIH
jgi:hypothetical protein